MTIEFYWQDLTPAKQQEITETLGDNGNWDVFPFCTLEIEDEGDGGNQQTDGNNPVLPENVPADETRIRDESAEAELTDSQIQRIDEIHNAVSDLCGVLTERDDLKWDMSYIGEIADVACDILVKMGFQIRYPAIITDRYGTERVVDYHNEG